MISSVLPFSYKGERIEAGKMRKARQERISNIGEIHSRPWKKRTKKKWEKRSRNTKK